jgi:DNA-binding MarR family transcriptional regulator
MLVTTTILIAVSGELQKEIKQNKPFATLEEEVMLNLQRTANVLAGRVAGTLKPYELSGTQYNVLRILRGSIEGLACSEISERLVTKDSDITRLLDRLEKRGLIARKRSAQDKRVIIATITAQGKKLLLELDPEVSAAPQRYIGHLGNEMLEQLNALLVLARK